jgi:hypothetical protein
VLLRLLLLLLLLRHEVDPCTMHGCFRLLVLLLLVN